MVQTNEDVDMTAATSSNPTKETKKQKKLKERKAKQAKQLVAGETDSSELALTEKTPTWTALTHHISPRPVLFSLDGRFVFVAAGAAIKIYDASTGTLLSSLVPPPENNVKENPPAILREDASVTCLRFNPQNSMQLITGGLDGRVRFWDYTNGVMLRSVYIGYQIQDIATHPSITNFIYLATINQPASFKTKTIKDPEMSTNESSVMRLGLKKGALPKRLLLSKDSMVQLGISYDGQFLVAASMTGLNILRVHNTYGGWVKTNGTLNIRCIAIHPSQPVLAIGEASGSVKIFRAFETAWWDSREKSKRGSGGTKKALDYLRPSVATYTWHARPVSSLAFTLNGAQVLSGGEEGVLVLWQLSNGSRDFISRIGAPISSITCAPITADTHTPEAAIALVDGRVGIASLVDKRILRNMSGLRLDYTIEEPSRRRVKADRPLTFQPGSNHVVCLSSHPSAIQLYNLSTDMHVKEIEICKSNRVARREGSYMDPQRVEHVTFTSPNPTWMATFDSWQSLDWAFTSNLKFWHQHDTDPAFYYLVTLISNPHGTSTVSAMAFPPAGAENPRLITAGADGVLKTWAFQPENRSIRQRATWKQQAEFRHRGKTARALAWSPDGSLFAVAHNDTVSLWLADTLTCLHTFLLPADTGKPNSLSFGGEGDEYLSAGCANQTIGWSLLDYTEQFVIDANSGVVPSLPTSSDITIIDCPTRRKGKTSIITAQVGKAPSLKTIHLEHLERPTLRTFLPASQPKQKDLLLYATDEGDVYAPSEALAHPQSTDLASFQSAFKAKKSRLSLFDDIFDAGKEQGILKKSKPSEYRPAPKGSTAAVLAQPSHMLPSLKQLWQQAILLPPPASSSKSVTSQEASRADRPVQSEPTGMDVDNADETLVEEGNASNVNGLGITEALSEVDFYPAPSDLIASVAKRL